MTQTLDRACAGKESPRRTVFMYTVQRSYRLVEA